MLAKSVLEQPMKSWAWFLKGRLVLIQDWNFVLFSYYPSHVLLRVTFLSYHYPILKWRLNSIFVSLSCIFLDKKTLIKILLNPGLNLTIFQGTRSWPYKPFVHSLVTYLCNGCCLRHRWNLTLVKSVCETALKSLFWAPAVYLDSKTVKCFFQYLYPFCNAKSFLAYQTILWSYL